MITLVLAGVLAWGGAGPGPLGAPRADTLRLRDGRFLVGRVERADENGVVFRRADNGGVVELPWRDLAPDVAARIRASWNLIDPASAGEVLVPALKVVVETPGGSRRTIVGELVSRDGKTLVLRRKTLRFEVPVAQLRGIPETLEVPIRELLTPEQIYQRKLAEIQPGEDPDKHAALADYLIRVEDYARARDHLLKAKELGGGAQAATIDARLKKVETLLANKEQADLLARINVLRNRREFEKARALVKEFEQRFPNSPLKGELEARKRKLEEARRAYLVRRVAGDWYATLLQLAKTKAVDRSLGFEEAKTFAAEELGQEIRLGIAARRKLDPAEVEELFKARSSIRGRKEYKAGYGSGSWILGKEGVVRGTKIEKIAAKKRRPADEGKDRERAMRRRIRDFLRRLARQGAGGKTKDLLETPEKWWRGAQSLERQNWLMAYYAENGGDYEVVSVHLRPCPTCGAKGFLEGQAVSGGKTQRIVCPTCHGTRYFRIVRFR